MKPIIVLDNDECIGSWIDLSLMYSILINFHPEKLSEEVFVEIINKTQCCRPYLRELYDNLLELKSKGLISGIYMCTAAHNASGWVDFLARILERWYGKIIYDGIVHGQMIVDWHFMNDTDYCNDTGYIKDMNMIRNIANISDNIPVIAIDDRACNIINGYSISVTPFKIAVNLFNVFRTFFPDIFDIILMNHKDAIDYSWEHYMNYPHMYTKTEHDTDIMSAIEIVTCEVLAYSKK